MPQQLTGRIPQKYFDIASFAVVFAGYFFIFDDGLKHPELTIIGTIGGAWLGYEVAAFITKMVKTKRN